MGHELRYAGPGARRVQPGAGVRGAAAHVSWRCYNSLQISFRVVLNTV
jgi:hypothetical protein